MKGSVTRFDELLSPLESDVLGIIWPDKRMKVRQVYDQLRRKRKVALSSIAVILDRLHGRGVVDRTMETARGGVRYTYFPRQDKDGFEKGVVAETVDKLIDAFGPTAMSYFNERFNKRR